MPKSGRNTIRYHVNACLQAGLIPAKDWAGNCPCGHERGKGKTPETGERNFPGTKGKLAAKGAEKT